MKEKGSMHYSKCSLSNLNKSKRCFRKSVLGNFKFLVFMMNGLGMRISRNTATIAEYTYFVIKYQTILKKLGK